MAANTELIVGASGSGHRTIAHSMAEARGAFLLNLDPTDQDPLPPYCVSLCDSTNSLLEAQFLGSNMLVHDPISVLLGIQRAITAVTGGDQLIVALPIQVLSPVSVHMYRAIHRMLEPNRLVAVGDVPVRHVFGKDPDASEAARPDRLGPRAEKPKRKAWWVEYIANNYTHKFALHQARFVGARLGAGQPLTSQEIIDLQQLGFPEALHAELCGTSLTIVTGSNHEPDAAPRAADHFGCTTAHLISIEALLGLVVGLYGVRHRFLGIGRICDVESENAVIVVQSRVEPSISIEYVHLGRIRLGADGEELGYTKPWQV